MSAVDEIAAYLAHLKTGGNRIDQIIFDEIPNGEGMSATDELRRLLDGRGVEWGAEESELDHVTTWNANGGQAMFYESKTTNPNLLQVNYYHLTPAQAVDATLGRGTCHDTGEDDVRIDELNAENAKLRELVLDYEELTAKLCDSRECDGCPFDSERTICEHMRLIARVGELGVEV